jgi:adenylyltransferase/sulfurtransferase
VQAAEALKLILKKGEPLIGRFLIYSALEADFRTIAVGKNQNCPLCGPEPTITTLSDCYEGTAPACETRPG